MTAAANPDELREALAWLDDIDVVGDGPDGPIYVLRDGTVLTIPVPEG